MILETAQMLSTAHRVIDGDEYADRVGLYKMHTRTILAQSGQGPVQKTTCGLTDCLVHCVASIPIDTKNTMHQKDY